MPRKLGVLLFAVVLLAASYPVGWAWTGGFSTALDPQDSRVLAAIAGARDPVVEKAWMKEAGGGYEVSAGYRTATGYWLTTVRLDAGGNVLSDSTRMWTGKLFPVYLRRLSAVFAVLWVFAAFVAPHVFGVKCPDCPKSFVSSMLSLWLKEPS